MWRKNRDRRGLATRRTMGPETRGPGDQKTKGTRGPEDQEPKPTLPRADKSQRYEKNRARICSSDHKHWWWRHSSGNGGSSGIGKFSIRMTAGRLLRALAPVSSTSKNTCCPELPRRSVGASATWFESLGWPISVSSHASTPFASASFALRSINFHRTPKKPARRAQPAAPAAAPIGISRCKKCRA